MSSSNYGLHISASYDIKAPVRDMGRKRVTIGKELSICVWVRLEELLQPGAAGSPYINLIQILSGPQSQMRIALTNDNGQLILKFVYGSSFEKR